jgi:diguanylate cyclase (GGDEF)-like protein/PAS domain S-box-containing protein
LENAAKPDNQRLRSAIPTSGDAVSLALLTAAFRNHDNSGRFDDLAVSVTQALMAGLADRCLLWMISPGGVRTRLATPAVEADRAWRPTVAPVAQVLAAKRTIEMGVVEDLYGRDDTTMRVTGGEPVVRAFGRFIPVSHGGDVVAVLGAVRNPGRALFTANDRAILDSAAERLEAAYAISYANEQLASRKAPGLMHGQGLLLADDLLTRLGAISGDVVFRHLFRGGTEYISSGVFASLGYTPEEVMNDALLLDRLIHPDDRHVLYDIIGNAELADSPLLIRMVRRNGQLSWQLIRALAIIDSEDRVLGIEGFATDVTAMKQAEAELSHQARSDALTGLANRLNFRESTSRALARIERHPGMMGVLFLDLDGFKLVNDTLGHAAGDNVLQQVAERLRKAIRREDMVARLGGDEFAVLLVELRNEGEATATARRILEALEVPLMVMGSMAEISTGVGIAVTTSGTITPDELINRADVALYQAKRSGRGRWQVYEGANGSASTAQATLLTTTPTEPTPATQSRPMITEGLLRSALAAGEFRVHYLPEIDTRTGRVSSIEALVRWQHPELGLLPASAFIHELGDMDVLHPLGDWIMRVAAKQVLLWQTRFEVPMALWVNISANQLGKPGFAESVLATLASVGFAPRDLGLDIPELALNGLDAHHDVAVATLHKAGIRLAVDDFGVGAASLRTLRRLPISQIKIDRSLIDDVDRIGGGDDELVQLAIKLAGSLGAEVVAVGVERSAQLDRLRALQCAFFQGFLAGEARTADEITALLSTGQLGLPGLQ